MSTTARFRQRGGNAPIVAQDWVYNSQTSDGYYRTTTDSVGITEQMNDWVTKPFVPGRIIANTSMVQTKEYRTQTPAIGGSRMDSPPGFNGYDRSTGAKILVRDTSFTTLLGDISTVDTDNLVAQACTQALANVRRPEVSGLVSIAEIRSTIASLLNPVNGALNWLSRNAPTKMRRRKKTFRRSVKVNSKDLADQHLTIVFGILPFISDIQGILKALEAIEPLPTRFTARGSASAHGQNTTSVKTQIYNDGTNITHTYCDDKVEKTVTARAYQLYETSVTLTNSLGLSVSDVPKALWQTATLSFVVDWFANVGDFISAITPQEGIRLLASGYTVTTVEACTSDYSEVGYHTGAYGWNSTFVGGNQTRVKIAKSRVPGSLGSYARIVLKSNMHRDVLDTFKITAGISLLTQRLTKLL